MWTLKRSTGERIQDGTRPGAFRLPGEGTRHPGTASQGCIIPVSAAGPEMEASGGHDLMAAA